MFRSSRAAAIALLAIIMLAPAASANCDECFAAKQSVSQEQGRLLADFPGTSATLLACMAACSETPQSERGGCVVASCGVACLTIGIEHCFNFFNRMAAVQSRSNDVDKFCRARNCQ